MSNKTQISQTVLKKIKNNRVKMRSSAFYVILSVLIVSVGLISSFLAGYISRLMFFWLKIINPNTQAYGAKRNLAEAIWQFPWFWLLVLAALIVSLVFIIKEYRNIYGKKAGIIVAVTLVTIVLFGILLFGLGVFDLIAPVHGGYWMKNY